MGFDNKKWLAGAGIVTAGLAAVGAVSHAVTRELVSIAVDRDYPRNITERARRQFTGSKENEAFMQHMEQMAQRLETADTRTVTITASDGEKLVGHWYSCKNAKRVVIAMHGWRSSWSLGFGMIADFLHSSGCSVLYAEQRGQGNSGGAYMGLGALERHDCLAWINWVLESGCQLPIYLAGVSMGATTVLMATGLGLPENVRGIVADCGFTSPEDIGRHVVSNNLHLSYRLRAGAADSMCRTRNKVGIRGCSAVDALKENSVPVLFIHGADDRLVPVTMTYENYAACAGPKELLIIPGADHGMSYYVDKKRYEAALKSFWERYDT